MREKADYQNTFKLEQEEREKLLKEANGLRVRMCNYVKDKL